MKSLLLLLILLTIAHTQDKQEATKMNYLQRFDYPDKTLAQQKKLLIKKAKQVSLTHYCYSNPFVSVKSLKQEARYRAYIEIISQYKPLINITGEQAEQFIHHFTIRNEKSIAIYVL